MALLVRKIARAKWPDTVCEITNICGDAIGDLRTSKNTLSTWKIDSLDDLESAILALAASSKTTKIETMSVVWFPEDKLSDHDIAIDEGTLGDTVISDLQNTHRDLSGVTYKSLGVISSIIINQISTEKSKRYTKSEVRKILIDAYQNERIQREKCDPKLLTEIENYLGK